VFRLRGDTDAMRFSILDVNAVLRRPCTGSPSGLAHVGGSPAALVRALARIPRASLVVPPAPDDRFGVPGTHLRLATADNAICGTRYVVYQTPGGLIWLPSQSMTLDLWVVDVQGHRLLVEAIHGEGTTNRELSQLHSIVKSLDFAMPQQ
jgi:hypothetical protein